MRFLFPWINRSGKRYWSFGPKPEQKPKPKQYDPVGDIPSGRIEFYRRMPARARGEMLAEELEKAVARHEDEMLIDTTHFVTAFRMMAIELRLQSVLALKTVEQLEK